MKDQVPPIHIPIKEIDSEVSENYNPVETPTPILEEETKKADESFEEVVVDK